MQTFTYSLIHHYRQFCTWRLTLNNKICGTGLTLSGGLYNSM